mmetsp:Transcript_29531/g.69537  ORF Transcript_29531/g.69537 Transcript_29531/m.69537 type:complete len:265 (+) Transcript_29531:109-903(+)
MALQPRSDAERVGKALAPRLLRAAHLRAALVALPLGLARRRDEHVHDAGDLVGIDQAPAARGALVGGSHDGVLEAKPAADRALAGRQGEGLRVVLERQLELRYLAHLGGRDLVVLDDGTARHDGSVLAEDGLAKPRLGHGRERGALGQRRLEDVRLEARRLVHVRDRALPLELRPLAGELELHVERERLGALLGDGDLVVVLREAAEDAERRDRWGQAEALHVERWLGGAGLVRWQDKCQCASLQDSAAAHRQRLRRHSGAVPG